MKLKTRFLITLVIFSFLSSLFSFFPIQKTHALWTTCEKYEDWKDLPPIDFSVDKTGNDTYTASITSPKSVMDRWATRAPNKDFMILAFNGNVAYANKLDFNIGKAILYNNATNSYTTQSFTILGNNLSPGTYDITFRIFPEPVPKIQAGEESLNGCAIDSGPISRSLTIPQPPPPDGSTPPPDGSTPPPGGSTPPPVEDKTCEEECPSGVCNENDECIAAFACKKYSNGNYKCITAIGGIETNPEKFVQNILRILLGLAGGILLILIIINGYKIMTSQGDPEKLKDAREGIIAAIAGILLIIFSLSLLQLITVDIIGIPGFGS